MLHNSVVCLKASIALSQNCDYPGPIKAILIFDGTQKLSKHVLRIFCLLFADFKIVLLLLIMLFLISYCVLVNLHEFVEVEAIIEGEMIFKSVEAKRSF